MEYTLKKRYRDNKRDTSTRFGLNCSSQSNPKGALMVPCPALDPVSVSPSSHAYRILLVTLVLILNHQLKKLQVGPSVCARQV